jgi:O-antigen ligase
VCFLLIPLSIVFIKYFPELGKNYDPWTGEDFFIGVTTSKNMLGVLCLVGALFFAWDTLTRLGQRDEALGRSRILVNVAFVGMSLWLLTMANSATSGVCLALGVLIVVVAQTKIVKRHPRLLTVSIPVGIVIYSLLEFVFGVNIIAALAVAVGRNPDLTGRTNIWDVVLATGTNPIVGVGYESFWLGERLQWVWSKAGPVNEAHNGFLEVYLTLGLVGLSLYCGFLIGSYWSIAKRLGSSPFGSIGLALWTVLVFYNVTESALRGQLMWVVFILVATTIPGHAIVKVDALRVAREALPGADMLGRRRNERVPARAPAFDARAPAVRAGRRWPSVDKSPRWAFRAGAR